MPGLALPVELAGVPVSAVAGALAARCGAGEAVGMLAGAAGTALAGVSSKGSSEDVAGVGDFLVGRSRGPAGGFSGEAAVGVGRAASEAAVSLAAASEAGVAGAVSGISAEAADSGAAFLLVRRRGVAFLAGGVVASAGGVSTRGVEESSVGGGVVGSVMDAPRGADGLAGVGRVSVPMVPYRDKLVPQRSRSFRSSSARLLRSERYQAAIGRRQRSTGRPRSGRSAKVRGLRRPRRYRTRQSSRRSRR